jgi:hypothetical protein
VQSAFVIVVVAVGVVGVLGALACLLLSRRTWESLGRDRLLMESELHAGQRSARPAGAGLTPAGRAERDEEVRQMLQARNARRRRRRQPELDVEAELARLTAEADPAAGPEPAAGVPPALDPELRVEIRELVIARNHRRVRRGQEPLDIDAEVAREIERLSR